MDLNKLYEEIIGVVAPWKITDIQLDRDKKPRGQVIVSVAYCASDDRRPEGHIHGYVSREWRHLDSCQFQTRIVARVPRFKKADGSTFEVDVPWADHFSRMTYMMEDFVIDILTHTKNHSAAAELLNMSRSTLDRVMTRAVERGMARREEEEIKTVGIDEKAMRRRHRYVTVLNDIERGRVIDLVENRDQKSAVEVWKKLTPKQRDMVEAVAMDMWPAFMKAAKIMVPDASIVHDRYHVASYLAKSVDEVRRSENRELISKGDERLKGTKYDWLKSRVDLRHSSSSRLRDLRNQVLETAKAWGYKEWFDHFWSYRSETWAKKFFDVWYRSAIHTSVAPLKKVARMLKNHLPGLLNYSQYPISNATAEGLNSKIQSLRVAARGLPNFKTFRIRVLFHCGKLDLKTA